MGVVSEGWKGGGVGRDCRVGTIVWVRRRNGSWWPGRILGQHELSASHLMSPRSGTPVKLLGREDASVDWYNLEKSKRVKAFRCGEFDASIERAESLQGAPIKKREKYARREDAILHALELEKQMLERHHMVGSSSSSKYSGILTKESDRTLPSESNLQNGKSLDTGKYINNEKVDLPFVEGYMGNSSYEENVKTCALPKYEDGISKATQSRMGGLQDFGLRTCTSEKKLIASSSYESSQKLLLMDTHAHAFPGSIKDEEGWNNSSNSKKCSSLKKKRSPSGFSEEGLCKRHDRRKPLLQVLQSSAKLSASQSSLSNCESAQEERAETGVMCHSEKNHSVLIPEGANGSLYGTGHGSDYMQISPSEFRYPVFVGEENASSGQVEPDESDSSATFDLDPEVEAETSLPGTSQHFSPESRNSGRSVEDDCYTQGKNGNIQNDAGLSPRILEFPREQTEDTSVDARISRWNLKGKRNVRKLSKMATESVGNKKTNGLLSSADRASYESKRSLLNSRRESFVEQSFSSEPDDFCRSGFTQKDPESEMSLYGYTNYPLMLKGASGGPKDSSMVDSDDDSHGLSRSGRETYAPSRMQSDGLGPHFGQQSSDMMESMLVYVNLKVQAASYQGVRVPLVSLMSKLNGKAIVGYPVQIEKLDDGSTNSLFPKNDSGVPSGYSGNTMPPPVWQTGRRTAMQRVPRPHPASSALEDSDTLFISDPESRPMFKRPYAVRLNDQAKLMKNSSLGQRPMPRKSKKKSSKKVGLSNQKTKRLSSIAKETKHSSVSGKPATRTSILDELVKPGNAVPVVICVPVKVVFSRIIEAVGRTPSTTAAGQNPLTDVADLEPS